MQATPLFVSACVLASIAGVVSGNTINTRPIQRGGIGMEQINRPAINFASDSGLSEQLALPDHYAINTPEGRFDVAELASRGIYAQRRFAWDDAQYVPPPEPAFVDPPRDDYADESTPAFDPPADLSELNGADDKSIEQPAEVQGEARLINVDLALAER
jgi:hypothetical protein